MPRGDGRGSLGKDKGRGRGMRKGREGMGGNKPEAGAGGNCVCPSFGIKVPHQVGVPCYDLGCPGCGQRMTRD